TPHHPSFPTRRSSDLETSLSIWRRSKPTRAAWWSFVTRCEDIMASHGTPPPDQAMERTAIRQENYKGELESRKLKSELALGSGRSEEHTSELQSPDHL